MALCGLTGAHFSRYIRHVWLALELRSLFTRIKCLVCSGPAVKLRNSLMWRNRGTRCPYSVSDSFILQQKSWH